jgi:hypothetical protein
MSLPPPPLPPLLLSRIVNTSTIDVLAEGEPLHLHIFEFNLLDLDNLLYLEKLEDLLDQNELSGCVVFA